MNHKRLLLALLLTLAAPIALLSLGKLEASPAEATKVHLPLLPCHNCPGPSPTPWPTREPPSFDEYIATIIRLINVERDKFGCPPLNPHPALMQAAHDWAARNATTGELLYMPYSFYINPPYSYPGVSVGQIIGPSAPGEMYFEALMGTPGAPAIVLFCENRRGREPFPFPNRVYDIGLGMYEGSSFMTIDYRDNP